MSANDTITVSVDVPLSSAEAFALFTERIDAWWKRGPAHRFRSPWTTGALELIPGEDGRLIERYPDGGVVEIGRMRTWEPPRHFLMEWRLPVFASDETTDVEVTFKSIDTGCRVEVRHSGWSRLRPDHPARHGLEDRQFLATHGHLWSEQLNSLRTLAVREKTSED
jgi:activator of HSP90 ATPase